MRKSDFFERFKDFWADFKKEKLGLIALGLMAVFVLVIIFEPLILPFRAVNSNWLNITYWEDNPASAPPVWTDIFKSKKSARTEKLLEPVISEADDEHFGKVQVYSYTYNYTYDISPCDVIFRAELNGTIAMGFEVVRPDGSEIEFGVFQHNNMNNYTLRFAVLTDARDSMKNFASQYGASSMSGYANPVNLLFSEGSNTMYRDKKPLKGEYTFKFVVPADVLYNDQNTINAPRIMIPGAVSGVMGTDLNKRDIFSGLIAGLKWALLIGLLTSLVSVVVGVTYGIISAYFGGRVDAAMMFIFEIFLATPMVPVLIVFSAMFKASIWVIITALVIFNWVGPVKIVRSMALQIKEETYIEAAKALGAGKWRIIFKHITPILLPYSFALMAQSVPGAIVTEATLSLLGLGDPTIVSWGQILHAAQNSGATLNGIWWWIIPPGLCIAVMGMIFAFLGFAMDKILHPKLKTR